jgi:hypothetical protein
LIDHATFPRDKICGGGLTPKGWKLLDELIPDLRYDYNPIRRIRLEVDDSRRSCEFDTDIELRRYTSPADLQGGFFDIMEPVGEVFTHEEEIEVAVVPGMGFDGRGNRLGRGKGYYDRLLARLPHTYKIGVCFDFQKMPGIPADEHDIKMDVII